MATESRILCPSASLRAVSIGDTLRLDGYAAKFNQRSKPLPQGFVEQIKPFAFTRSLAEKADVRCLFNHNSDRVLGRVKNDTLRLATDSKGLRFTCQLNKDSQEHRDLHASVKRGDIDACSFAFAVPEGGDSFDDGTDEDGQRCIVRTLNNVKLFDVSVVTHPAYEGTSVDARAAAEQFVARSSNVRQFAEMRRLLLKYSGVALEDLAPRVRTYGEGSAMLEDALNQLRINRQIRSGWAFGDGPSSGAENGARYQAGQTGDPEQTFRDDEGDIYPQYARTKADHEESCIYHRNCASKAKTMDRGVQHFRCADLHDVAARAYPDLTASQQARAASLKLAAIS